MNEKPEIHILFSKERTWNVQFHDNSHQGMSTLGSKAAIINTFEEIKLFLSKLKYRKSKQRNGYFKNPVGISKGTYKIFKTKNITGTKQESQR